MFSSNDKRAMNQGFGDGMSRAFELVVTPLVFGGIGYLLDTLAGTAPVFLVALGVFGVVGVFVRAWIGYDLEMRSHEASGPWMRGAAPREPEPAEQSAEQVDIWSISRTPARGASR